MFVGFATLRDRHFSKAASDVLISALDDTPRVSYNSPTMIQGFACPKTKRLFEEGICQPQWRTVKRVASRKLDMLDAAVTLKDLGSPPGNRLEQLKGDRRDQYSIRVNEKWRVCFVWSERGPGQVKITDYH